MSRPLVSLAGLVALLGAGVASLGPTAPPRAVDPLGGHPDLKLVAERYQPAGQPVRAGTPTGLGMVLVNTSLTRSYPVVEPGDGSEARWREPFVYWSATVDRGDGRPVAAPRADLTRDCANFDGTWRVVVLGPGGRLPINDAVPPDWQLAGRVRVRGHYSYGAGRNGLGRVPLGPDALGPVAGVPPFELVSDPVEFTVVRPLDTQLRVKQPLRVGVVSRLSDVVDATITNRSAVPVWCHPPRPEDGGWFRFEQRDRRERGDAGSPDVTQDGGPEVGRLLPPGRTVSLIGPGFARGLDGTWQGSAAGDVQVRVVYVYSPPDQSPDTPTTESIASEWVMLRIDP